MPDFAKLAERLRGVALAYPETYEEAPWGDRVVKVRGKIFLFCGTHEGKLHVTTKLPESRRAALTMKFAAPTGYGLGKAGWVTSTFERGSAPPVELLTKWIGESYRALAPKKLLTQLQQKNESSPSKKSIAQKATKKIKKRVLLLAYDPLRARRAVEGFAARGLAVELADDPAAARKRLAKPLDALIVDLGKRAAEGLALAGEVDQSDAPVHIFLAGIPDGKLRKRAQAAATSAELFRGPPGDPEVLDAVVKTFSR